jgi:hypothetical protein
LSRRAGENSAKREIDNVVPLGRGTLSGRARLQAEALAGRWSRVEREGGMARLGLETHLVDGDVYRRTLARFHDAGVVLPTFGELKDPSTIPPAIAGRLGAVDPDSPPIRSISFASIGSTTKRAAVARRRPPRSNCRLS